MKAISSKPTKSASKPSPTKTVRMKKNESDPDREHADAMLVLVQTVAKSVPSNIAIRVLQEALQRFEIYLYCSSKKKKS
jgi:hypothetical protein